MWWWWWWWWWWEWGGGRGGWRVGAVGLWMVGVGGGGGGRVAQLHWGCDVYAVFCPYLWPGRPKGRTMVRGVRSLHLAGVQNRVASALHWAEARGRLAMVPVSAASPAPPLSMFLPLGRAALLSPVAGGVPLSHQLAPLLFVRLRHALGGTRLYSAPHCRRRGTGCHHALPRIPGQSMWPGACCLKNRY